MFWAGFCFVEVMVAGLYGIGIYNVCAYRSMKKQQQDVVQRVSLSVKNPQLEVA